MGSYLRNEANRGKLALQDRRLQKRKYWLKKKAVLMQTRMKIPDYKIPDFERQKNYFDQPLVCETQRNDEKTTHNFKLRSCNGYAFSYASTLNNWALYHAKRGNFLEASHLLKRSYGIRKVFWPHHPTTATTVTNLALMYNFGRLLREAEITSLEAVDLMERTKSADYLQLALHLFGLASLYKHQRKYKDEESSYRFNLIYIRMALRCEAYPSEQLYNDILAEACQRENNCIEGSSEPNGKEVLQTLEADKIWFQIANIPHPTVGETIKKLIDLYACRDDYNLIS
uniref:Uncharacterized protein n=1 Tax=Glossina morsitans morsitans TaxID=37546 RepID=A0A1B0FMA4_GLOMM